MSARNPRRKRWEQWNRRPSVRALASQGRRERFTLDELRDTARTSMQAGETMGRKWGERDTYEFLADLLDDPQELTAQIGGRALTSQADDFLLVERVNQANPEAVRRIADILDRDDLTGEQKKDELEAFAREIGIFPEGVTTDDSPAGDGVVVEIGQWMRDRGRPATRAPQPGGVTATADSTGAPAAAGPHPSWCDHDHTGEAIEFEGVSIGIVHERVLAEVTGAHGAWTDQQATASVYVERSDECGEVVTPTRVVLCVAEGPEGVKHGSQDSEAWSGTPEQAEDLAAALLEAARIVRDRGTDR